MAKMYKVGPPENSGELLALEHLEAHLPDSYVVLGGVTVLDRNGAAQIDAVVLGQYGIFTVEVKDWKGKLSGHFNGPWQADARRMPNPCNQARRCSQILRSNIRNHATGLLTDKRVFFAIDVFAVVVLVDPNADTTGVTIEEDKHFRMCKDLESLVTEIQRPQTESKRFLTLSEIQRIAEFLGVPKSTIDTWAQPKGDVDISTAPPSKPTVCPTCGADNRESAKHCRSCGNVLRT